MAVLQDRVFRAGDYARPGEISTKRNERAFVSRGNKMRIVAAKAAKRNNAR